ncbi:MAG TPA: hypothetical protein VF789_09800 [Thermoanaerobaculia bacterium]
MPKRAVFVLAAALLVAVSAWSQDRDAQRESLVKAVQAYARMQGEGSAPVAPEKAVPRTDKAEAVIIGTVEFVDSVDFLDDGTPFRFVDVEARRPFDQFIPVVCLGNSAVNTCGRLVEGRRVQFTGDLLIDDETGLALVIVKKVKT